MGGVGARASGGDRQTMQCTQAAKLVSRLTLYFCAPPSSSSCCLKKHKRLAAHTLDHTNPPALAARAH